MTPPSYRISVIIPTYRRCASVLRALRALARQMLPPEEFEVIVSIDGSEDGTREAVAHFQAPYKLHAIWQPNRGRAAACNAGIQVAAGEVLVLLDDDMEPAPQFLDAHLRAHSAGPALGVLGAVPITRTPSSPPVAAYIGAKFNSHLEKLSRPGYDIHFRDFYSGNFSIRGDVLRAVGAFDETFKIYGNEDGELALRLMAAGVRLVYSREALARQYYTKDFAALARDNIAKGTTAVLLAGKQPAAFRDLKLSTYRHGSRKWRLLRGLLLGLSGVWPDTPQWVIQFVAWREQRRAARLRVYYVLALDYFYWLGARAALRERYGPGRMLPRLAKLAEGSSP